MKLTSLDDIPRGAYGVLYADPPWAWRNWSGADVVPQRKAEQHYPTMSLDELRALPMADFGKPDCCLFMWITAENLANGMALAEHWGFRYISKAFTWVKITQDTDPDGELDDMRTMVGMGKWTRYESEDCYLFTRGSPSRLSAAVRQVVFEPRREHSRKPDSVRQRVQALAAGPRLELFGRASQPNWDVWNNEPGKFDV